MAADKGCQSAARAGRAARPATSACVTLSVASGRHTHTSGKIYTRYGDFTGSFAFWEPQCAAAPRGGRQRRPRGARRAVASAAVPYTPALATRSAKSDFVVLLVMTPSPGHAHLQHLPRALQSRRSAGSTVTSSRPSESLEQRNGLAVR